MFYTIAILVVALPFLCWLFRFYWSVLMTRDLPPGPFPLPVIGNLHLLSSNMHISLEELAKTYGDIMTLYIGTERVVVVSNPDLACEVLVRQSSVFGGRPKNLPYGAYLISKNGKDMASSYDMTEQWKKQRKMLHGALKSFGSGLLVLEELVNGVVEDLLRQLETYQGTVRDLSQDVGLCAANIICSMTFGSKYNEGDKEFEMIVKALDTFQKSLVAGNLVDIFPFLRRLPIKFVLDLKQAIALTESVVMKKYHEHNDHINEGGVARDLTEALLRQRQSGTPEDDFDEEDVQMVISDIFVAGLETSAHTILWGICLLARRPEFQDIIHEEMRRCLGSGTLPKFHDRRRLPFLQATVTEIYRFTSISPILGPHRAVKDASITDYVIPQDTTVIVNAYAIHRNPEIWGDPNTFRPSRFLDEDGSYFPPSPNTFLPFGAGKRGCPGEVLGKLIVFITLARMLYFYRFTIVSDQNVGRDTRRQFLLKPRNFEVFIERNNWKQ